MHVQKGAKNIATGLVILIPISILTVFLAYAVSSAEIKESTERKINIIIDTDPGADDATAILLFLSKLSDANVLGITVVTGNTDIENGTKNALLVLQVANRLDIPVYAGSDQGLVYKAHSDHFFGNDGFGDTFTRKPLEGLKKSEHAANALVKYVKERPGEITILCIGPLTNIALAQHLYPKFLNNVKDIVILGGSFQGGGNVKPGVEFNIYGDPDAAAYIFANIPPSKLLTVVPLETVTGAEISLDWRINVLGKLDSCFMNFINRAERIALTKHKTWLPFDPLAASIILEPQIINTTKTAYMIVETCGEHGRGAFFRDDKHATHNVKLVTKVNKRILKELFLTYLNNSSEGCMVVN